MFSQMRAPARRAEGADRNNAIYDKPLLFACTKTAKNSEADANPEVIEPKMGGSRLSPGQRLAYGFLLCGGSPVRPV
jgi:hypothetical protein